jgi:hypothetical protein
LRASIGTNLSELIASVQGGRDRVLDAAIERAVARGEIRPGQLPVDLVRCEVLTTLKPIPDAVIEEIVDTIFLPLVRLGGDMDARP